MTSLDQNTPLSAETLAEIRRKDERDLRLAEKPEGALDETAWERHVLLAEVDRLNARLHLNEKIDLANEEADAAWKREVDRLTETAHNQARMLGELTSACVAAEGDALRHRTQVAELSGEVQRLMAERDKAVETATHMAGAMAKVGPALLEARRLAAAGDAAGAAAVLGDVAPEGVEEGGEVRG